MDEPLANLDINAQQTILTDLRAIAKSAYNPMGILLSSQQLFEVEKVADDVIFIRNGDSHYRNSEMRTAGKTFLLELESAAQRKDIENALQGHQLTIKYNGGIYMIESDMVSPEEILKLLFANDIPVTYFRDITHSTKRYF